MRKICDAITYFSQSNKNYRSVILAAKRKKGRSHWSKITDAFFRREYCLSSLTCQGGANKQKPRKLLFILLFPIYRTSARVFQAGYFKRWISNGYLHSIFTIGHYMYPGFSYHLHTRSHHIVYMFVPHKHTFEITQFRVETESPVCDVQLLSC